MAKVHLHLFAGRALDPPVRQLQLLRQTANTALHRLVAAGEAVIDHQVLVDALGRKPRRDGGGDRRQMLPAEADATTAG